MSVFKDRRGDVRFGWLILGVVALIVGVIFGIGAAITSWQASIDRDICRSFEQAAKRDTTFFRYNFWSWDCLTPAQDGKLISIERLRGLTDEDE